MFNMGVEQLGFSFLHKLFSRGSSAKGNCQVKYRNWNISNGILSLVTVIDLINLVEL